MMKIFSKLSMTVALAASIAVTGISSSASAALITGNLFADTGTYAPFALGENLELDGCGSVFANNQVLPSATITYSLCNGITNLAPFGITWSVFSEAFDFLGSVSPVGTLAYSMTTGGVSDIITAAGTYYLSLNVSLSPSSSTFALPGSNTGRFQPTPFNTSPNSHTYFSPIALVVNPSVPEPAAAFLLLPAMLYVARRQRRRAQKDSPSI